MATSPSLDVTFSSIEGSHHYLAALGVAIKEAQGDLETLAAQAARDGAVRREHAVRLAAQKLTRLEIHVSTGRRLLNDLRTLRRLLFDERNGEP